MRSSVVVVSSVSSSFNSIGRNARVDGIEPELYPSATTVTGGIRSAEDSSRAGMPQIPDEFVGSTHPKAVGGANFTGQVPFPRSPSPWSSTSENASVSTGFGGGSSLRHPTNTADNTAGVVFPRPEGVLTRCLTFLRRVGARLVMPPYTVDDGMNNIIARRRDYVNLIVQNATVTKLPLL